MNSRCQLVLLAIGIVATACGSPRSAAERFAGTWKLNDGRTITLVRGGATCSGDAVPYHARQRFPCPLQRQRHYRDDHAALQGHDRWIATLAGDSARPFQITATRVR